MILLTSQTVAAYRLVKKTSVDYGAHSLTSWQRKVYIKHRKYPVQNLTHESYDIYLLKSTYYMYVKVRSIYICTHLCTIQKQSWLLLLPS